MSLRSRHLRADAARLALGVAVLAIAACEGVFGLPYAADSGETTALPGNGTDGDAEDQSTTGSRDPTDAVDEGESDVGEGPALDLGPDQPDDPPPPNAGDCCLPAHGTGCGDDVVEACVCAVDGMCCESGWDELCAKEAHDLGCTVCDPEDLGPMTFGGSCCSASEDPGCLEDEISACVCASDPYCCMVAWDQVCVDLIAEHGCGDCTNGLPDCCIVDDTPGCDDAATQDCVCASDAFCCETAWDELCTSEVETFGCGSCSLEKQQPSDDCCLPSMEPGCIDPAVSDCVCQVDPYCCESIWDPMCVGMIDSLGCGSCFDVGTTGANDGGYEGTTGVDPTGMDPGTSSGGN